MSEYRCPQRPKGTGPPGAGFTSVVSLLARGLGTELQALRAVSTEFVCFDFYIEDGLCQALLAFKPSS